jgi:hypothetical protein
VEFILKPRVRVVCGKLKYGSSDDIFMDMDQGILVCKKSVMIEKVWAKEASEAKLGFLLGTC